MFQLSGFYSKSSRAGCDLGLVAMVIAGFGLMPRP